jgi:drug/metabolite transporter (DMT)-like permease
MNKLVTNTQIKLVLGAFIVASGWGVASIINKYILSHNQVSPSALLLIITSIAFVFLIGLYFIHPTDFELDKINWSHTLIFKLITTTVLGYLIAYYTLFYLTQKYDVHKVIALSYITPLITLILAYLFLKKEKRRINAKSLMAIVFIVLGTYILGSNEE